jgi:methyl-accepting chemotaxis protein
MKNSLKAKMLITIVGVLVLILASLAIVTSTLSYNATMDISEQYIKEQMDSEGLVLSKFFENHLNAAEAMVSAVKIAKDEGTLTRENVNNILINVLKDQPDAFDNWFVWEPNAFDGKDNEFIGSVDADEQGRFVPLAYRDGSNFAIDKCYAYDTDPYYLIPKETLKPYITVPTVYDIGGVPVNMVTISVPIVIDGKFYGAGGIDIAVDQLMADLNSVILFDTGFLQLLGPDATVFAHRVPENINTVAEEFQDSDRDQKLAKILSGEVTSEISHSDILDTKAYKQFVRFDVSEYGPTWILGATIPMAEITQEAAMIRNIIY